MTATRTGEEIARELESFYRHYIEVFNREDDRFYDCFAQPYGAVSERGLATIANDDDNRNSFRRTMTALKQRGWRGPISIASRRGRLAKVSE